MTSETGERQRSRMPRSARRAQLLESALEVFVAQGYHAAAMDDIAERAGVSKPVLYQHFPGKLELYLALLDDACDQVIDGVRHALASTDNNKERVAATTRSESIAGRIRHSAGGGSRHRETSLVRIEGGDPEFLFRPVGHLFLRSIQTGT